MLKLRKLSTLGVLALALACPPALRAAVSDILTQIPDDATGALVVRSVAALDQEVHNYAVQMGKPLPEDTLGSMLQNMGIKNGFDKSGPAAVVAVKMPAPKEGQDPVTKPYVLLLPTSDPKAMLENLQPTAPENGISTVTLPNQTENGYVATVGKFVAAAQDKTVLAAFLAHKGTLNTLNPRMVPAFDANDVILYANMAQLNAVVAPQIDQYAAMFKGLTMTARQGMSKEQQAMQEESMTLMKEGFKAYLNDTQMALITLRINDKGVALGMLNFFKPGTVLAKMATAKKALKPVNLDYLPSGDILAAGAAAWDGPTTADLLETVAAHMLANPDLGTQAAQMRKLVDLEKQMATLALRARFVVLAPPSGNLKNFTASIVVDSNDPEKLQNLLVEGAKQPVIQGDPDITTSITVEQNAEVVKNVRLYKYVMKMTPRAETPDHPLPEEKKKAYEMLLNMQGPKGYTFYTGVTNKKLVVLVGSDLKKLEPVIVAVQTNATTLNLQPEISGMQAAIVPGATSVVYLPIERWIQMAKAAAATSTSQPATAPAPGLALGGVSLPIALSSVAGEDSMQGEIMVPKSLLINITQQFMPLLGGGGMQ